MYDFIIGLSVVISILLVLVILAQNSKGGGLSSQFGGSAASNIIGVKKTGDLLEKLTWGFIVTLIVLTLSTSMLNNSRQDRSNDILNNAADQATPSQPAPAPLGEPIEESDSTN